MPTKTPVTTVRLSCSHFSNWPLYGLAFSMERVLPLQLQRELAIVAVHQGHLLLGP